MANFDSIFATQLQQHAHMYCVVTMMIIFSMYFIISYDKFSCSELLIGVNHHSYDLLHMYHQSGHDSTCIVMESYMYVPVFLFFF